MTERARLPGREHPAAGRGKLGRFQVRLLIVVVVALAATGVLAVTAMRGNFVYYTTPSELAGDPSLGGEQVRLGGQVVPGSIQREGSRFTFVLTDGATDVPVTSSGEPGGVFRAGQGALVQGVWQAGGPFRAERVMVKHSNEYGGTRDSYSPPPGDAGSRR